MFGKKAMQIEEQRHRIDELQYRVRWLEELLCPTESHDWVRVETNYEPLCDGNQIETLHRYKCKRCGKTRWDIL